MPIPLNASGKVMNGPHAAAFWGTADNAAPMVGVGELAAYTDPSGVASPAEIGLRILSQAGNIILDSVGISQVMKVLGSKLNQGITGVTGTGAWQALTASTVSFTLSRQITVLAFGSWTLFDATAGDTGVGLQGTILVDGTQNNSYGPVQSINIGTEQSTVPFAIVPLAAGSHTMALAALMTSGHTWSATDAYLYVLQLGG